MSENTLFLDLGEDNEQWIKRWMAAEDWYFTHALSEADVDRLIRDVTAE